MREQVGSLSSELVVHAERLSPRPRIYADANVSAGLVVFMREQLHWDVLFVMEEDDLRRAADSRHFQLAQQLRRTLITMDRDYLDDQRFPPDQGAGVLVIQAPDERQLAALLARIDQRLFRPTEGQTVPLPLDGQKLQLHTDWAREHGGAVDHDRSRSRSTPQDLT